MMFHWTVCNSVDRGCMRFQSMPAHFSDENMKKPLTNEQVLQKHLEYSRTGSDEAFLRSYREDSVLISRWGVYRGLDEIRRCFHTLQSNLPNARFTYKDYVVADNLGFLEWSAVSDTNVVADGADSYIIQDGYIRAQTIHYTLLPSGSAREQQS